MTNETTWKAYVDRSLPVIEELLRPHHISLLPDQPHLKGERFVIQALTTGGGRKLILLGIDTKTQKKVVVKASDEYEGKAELKNERQCRTLLHTMSFSYESFHSPKELFFFEKAGYTIFGAEYIEQTSSFLERPLEEQFSFALRALKAQEQTRATTATHLKTIKDVFGTRTSNDYLLMTTGFLRRVSSHEASKQLTPLLETALTVLQKDQRAIEQYGYFLTHTDFVPHNFRIRDNTLYLLDFSSLRFGNKHESWARFLNFMTLYNPALEALLLSYVTHNRAPEEQHSLWLMRLFRLTEIIAYYVGTLERSDGTLAELNRARIDFWAEVLQAELQHTHVDQAIVAAYIKKRDELRSTEEKERQIGLH